MTLPTGRIYTLARTVKNADAKRELIIRKMWETFYPSRVGRLLDHSSLNYITTFLIGDRQWYYVVCSRRLVLGWGLARGGSHWLSRAPTWSQRLNSTQDPFELTLVDSAIATRPRRLDRRGSERRTQWHPEANRIRQNPVISFFGSLGTPYVKSPFLPKTQALRIPDYSAPASVRVFIYHVGYCSFFFMFQTRAIVLH